MMDPRRNAESGFSLVETLVSLTIFAVMLSGLAPLVMRSTRSVDVARQSTAASTFARDKIEELRGTPFAGVASGEDQVAEPISGKVFTRGWLVGAGPTIGTRIVTVQVTWGTHSITLRTMVAE